MAQSVLERARADIRERIKELEPAVLEYERLDAALAALGDIDGQPASSRASRPRAARVDRRRKPAKRAPRGANRAAVLGVIGERPGVSVAELAAATQIAKAVLYSLLKTLEAGGEIQREELPSGVTGYRLASPDVKAGADAG